MSSASLHVGQHVRCPAARAYAYARDPRNLPAWAAGLGGAVRQVDGQWRVATPDGELVIEFAPDNGFGVLDHRVVLPSGEAVDNPMRVLADGAGLRGRLHAAPPAGDADADVESDARAVSADLLRLKELLEQGP
jgi:hypothetical protein